MFQTDLPATCGLWGVGINFIGCKAQSVINLVYGALTLTTVLAFAIAFPAAMVSVQIGIYAFRQVNDDQFRRTLIILCLAMGLGILAITVLGS